MAAGLKRDDDCAVLGSSSGLSQGTHLSMSFACPGMKALANKVPSGIKHHSAHQRVRAGLANGKICKLQGPAHPSGPA